jgi:hypothetical protein
VLPCPLGQDPNRFAAEFKAAGNKGVDLLPFQIVVQEADSGWIRALTPGMRFARIMEKAFKFEKGFS